MNIRFPRRNVKPTDNLGPSMLLSYPSTPIIPHSPATLHALPGPREGVATCLGRSNRMVQRATLSPARVVPITRPSWGSIAGILVCLIRPTWAITSIVETPVIVPIHFRPSLLLLVFGNAGIRMPVVHPPMLPDPLVAQLAGTNCQAGPPPPRLLATRETNRAFIQPLPSADSTHFC